MAIVIEANYSKKLGLPAYSSHSYSITIRSEIADMSQVDRESAKLYAILQSSVDRELEQEGYVPQPVSNVHSSDCSRNGSRATATSNQSNGEPWSCSEKQRDLILKIVNEHKLDKQEVEGLAKDMFQKPVKTLNRMEASGLIEELLEKFGPTKTNRNENRNGGRSASCQRGSGRR